MDDASSENTVFTPKRISLWMMAAAMVLIVALKEDRVGWPHFHVLGWPLIAASLLTSLTQPDRVWTKTLALFAYTITVLFFTRVNGETTNLHVIELTLTLGVGILAITALLAKYWLKTPLDYQWLSGRWSLRMWLWLPAGFVIAFYVLWAYFFVLTPTLHTEWQMANPKNYTESLWRIFWGCNLVGAWDELAWINFVFVLLLRRFKFWEANLAQAVFFTSFLFDMSFFGFGPIIIFAFALIQGYTYMRTRSLLYIMMLHLMIDTILFYMIANRWLPGWGWHP
jgi:membrane protease YdiL (CAAX protease family)